MTSTGVPIGREPEVHPLVSVLEPVLEQWAACPRYTFDASWKTKFDVHCAPSVNTWTPGWMVAELAGAHADAGDGAMARTEIAATAIAAVRAFRCIEAP